MRKAKRDIQQDKHGYDEVFNQVIHFQQEQLVRLEQLTNRIKGPDESYLAFFGATKASLRHIDVHKLGKKGEDPVRRSRFSLYRTALAIDPSFQAHARRVWADPSGGVHYAAKVKSTARAYQKVSRSYGGKFERVTDLVRTTIVYDTVEGLIRGVEAIAADPDVRILTLKNRFASGYVDPLSTGYRDVSITLHGVEVTGGLVCEVQLNLNDIFKIKIEDGHRRYIAMRDYLGD